jgi:hypothetical protein
MSWQTAPSSESSSRKSQSGTYATPISIAMQTNRPMETRISAILWR